MEELVKKLVEDGALIEIDVAEAKLLPYFNLVVVASDDAEVTGMIGVPVDWQNQILNGKNEIEMMPGARLFKVVLEKDN